MLIVLTSELGEEPTDLELQATRQTAGECIRFFQFNGGLLIGIRHENDIGKPLEVGVNGAIERELGIAE